jgi:hypothetical protein
VVNLLVQVKRSADLALASADTTIYATVPENIMEQNYNLLVWLNKTFKMQSFSLVGLLVQVKNSAEMSADIHDS